MAFQQWQVGFLSPCPQGSPRSEETARYCHQPSLYGDINTNTICPHSFKYFQISKKKNGNDRVGWFKDYSPLRGFASLCHLADLLSEAAVPALAGWGDESLCVSRCYQLSEAVKDPSHSRCPLASEVIFSMFAPVCCQPKLVITSSCVSDNPACMDISMLDLDSWL